MSVNTTQHLIDDMERLREHLGVEKWLLMGGSWASTLILAYAEQHPERVTEIILMGVTMTRRSEINWLDWGVRQFIPAAFERFHAIAPEATNGIEMAAAFNRLMEDPDSAVRAKAAADWCAWEDAVIAHEVDGAPGSYSARVGDARLAFVRICTHYFGNAAFLEEGVLLQEAGKLTGIPASSSTAASTWAARFRLPGTWPRRGRMPNWSSSIRATRETIRCAWRSVVRWTASPGGSWSEKAENSAHQPAHDAAEQARSAR